MPLKTSGNTTAKKATSSRTSRTSAKAQATAKDQNRDDGFELLRAQHKELKALAEKVAKGGNGQGQMGSLRELCRDWLKHARLEAEIVFPMLEQAGVDAGALHQAEIERDLGLVLVRNMMQREEGDDVLNSEIKVFCEMVPRLARLEERSLLAKAKRAGLDSMSLGRSLKEEISRSEQEAEEEFSILSPRYLRGVGGSSEKEYQMPMRGQERERDEQGRFMDEDDRRGGSRGGYSSRGRSSSSRGGRHEDDDERGWHGDPRGHSEAARRGWEHRRGGGGRYEDDYEDERYSSRGRSGGGSRSGRSQGGWFGDSEGHSQAARRGWDNPDHGDSGWFGDSEGHSQASRRGWQNPDHGESGWFGDREGHSQASRRGWERSDHGDSGWFGDPEGHSEASRRGWESRRRSDDDDDYRGRRGGGGGGSRGRR